MMIMSSNYSPVLNNWKAFGVDSSTSLTPMTAGTSADDVLLFKNKVGLSVDLGLGNDTLRLASVSNSAFDLGDGQDTLTATNVARTLISGGLGDDKMTVTGSYNILEGGVHGTAGSAELTDLTFGLLPGDREMDYADDSAPPYTGDNDIITATGHFNVISGQGGDDRLTATGNDNVLIGGYGSDYLTAKGNHNFLASGNLGGSDPSNGLVRDYLTVRGNDNVIQADAGDSIWITGGNNIVQITESSQLKGVLYATQTSSASGNFLFLNDEHSDFSFSVARSGKADLAIVDVDTPTSFFTVAGQFAKSGLLGVDAIYTADGYVLDAAGINQAAHGVDVSGLWQLTAPPVPEAVIPVF
jgi:hypothetical protein